MNSKLSNIGKWVFAALALITVVLAGYFFMDSDLKAGNRAGIILNWGYILIILGIVIALVSVVLGAIVKGVNAKKLLLALGAIVVIGVVAFVMAKGSFDTTYQAGEILYSGKTHGLVEFGLDFFYVTLGVSFLSILYSVIRSGK